MKRVVKKRGQIWIETVVYTLIAFVILGSVLSFAKPKIEELQDKSIIEQSIKMMEEIDSTMQEIKIVSGNKREMELGIRKGSLTIDGENELITFNIESKHTYSEPCDSAESCTPIKKGDIEIYNIKIGKLNKISAVMNYSGMYNITWSGDEQSKLLTQSSGAYKLFISNEGEDSLDKTIMDFRFI